ncbi:CDP-diacylglycerol--glycerol-3-phosphate 3-phosphatidyltransferase [Helicobacter sp. 11S03491-1]|uniref:CDP-diacylglycerol--glycerol-3-phosphate 3-phosphatidyltransferase n=1 Tax=Helicobacter sp. 11S03491-1 TaxID=1476196 RepID=UPI000BA50DF2|nr:CDP-diacylglycerol--glycerol-3-phosphate 3-phosphatidyltransferase [Helicobacter sp. 11S03491-1]PAF43903.1 CDP-diacylglycerol--glycerol-3-phosphate 3-phosphatidyltransferase [Helicobacter sp. 11S03491-1]
MKNLPNVLTISRIFLSVFLLIFILHGDIIFPQWMHKSWINYFSCLIFCIASLTDFFDGYIARNYHSKSVFGEVFDPLADKMLILSAFIGLLVINRANPWAVFIILSREFFITGLRVVVAGSGKRVGANMLGKYKTGIQILAIAFLLANFFPGGEILLWIATFATLYSGGDYALRYYKSMKICG